MATNKLIFKNAEEAKDAIMESQKKEIADLYNQWADEIAERAKFYSHKTNASASLSERYYKELEKQLRATSQEVSNEIYGKIKNNLYLVSDAVVADNVKWLSQFGFKEDGLNAAFSFVPDSVVRNLITGQIYDSGWSLSKRIWSDNEQTLKDIYQIMAKGTAENKSIYEIAKNLESYVRPGAKKSWNPILATKNTKTGEIEYKRIYKKQVDYNAQRLARTLTQHAYQQSFVATTIKNPFVTEYVWISNGSRVCDLCKARNGTHFKKDELPLDHPNGMCVMEPVIVDNMVDQLADWFNSPDGTYPEIDEFAGNFGYDAKPVNTTADFLNKYGMSTKSPNAWFNSLDKWQKAEATKLKDASGLTWKEWYAQNIYNGDGSNLSGKKKPNDVDVLKAAMEQAKAKLDGLGNKTYSGIWINDVTLEDYANKANSIVSKKEYYESMIAKYGGAEWKDNAFVQENLAKFKQYLKDLEEFEKLGKEYAAYKQAYQDAFSAYSKASFKVDFKGGFDPSAYLEEVKKKALSFDYREDADKYHRAYLDSIWDSLTDKEKYSVWEYTHNSNPINKSLSGYHDRWDRDYFLGLGNTILGHEDSWRTIDSSAFEQFAVKGNVSYKNVVQSLTRAVDKSRLTENLYLVRGSDSNGLAGLLEGNLLSFNDAKNLIDSGDTSKLNSVLSGQIFRSDSFLSTGIAKDSGFSGQVKYNIYAPAGTKGIYAEPQSYFGDTASRKMYKVGQSYLSVGTEAEVILQRGTEFRITGIKSDGYQITVDMEVVNQPDYFKTGLEHTHNGGKTSYKK